MISKACSQLLVNFACLQRQKMHVSICLSVLSAACLVLYVHFSISLDQLLVNQQIMLVIGVYFRQ